jgi:hypothetical protein
MTTQRSALPQAEPRDGREYAHDFGFLDFGTFSEEFRYKP